MGRRIFGLLAVLGLALAACSQPPTQSAQQIEQSTTARNQKQLNLGQPVPSFDFSQDRDTLIQIYKLRNEARNTWSVFLSDMGQPLYACPSVGFPIPGGTQLTNPSQVVQAWSGSSQSEVIPLPEPNGLYTDPNTNSTWVLCVRSNGDVVPVYSEPKVMAFPFPVDVQGGKIVEVAGGKSSATVEKKRG